ncbi:MAG: hypothetical protein N2506_00875 [Dehalococcoidales bacterium]|nr:hypothetical protein [Dehalococcoidales bacterium]
MTETMLKEEPRGRAHPDPKNAAPERKVKLKAFFLFTVTGPLVVLTSYDRIENPEFLRKLRAVGFNKFVAHEIPVEKVKQRYGTHFEVVCNDPNEDDTLRILDYKSERAIRMFSFREFGPPVYYEYEEDNTLLSRLPDYEAEYLRVYPKYGS